MLRVLRYPTLAEPDEPSATRIPSGRMDFMEGTTSNNITIIDDVKVLLRRE